MAGPSALMEQPVVAPPAVRRLAVNFVLPCLVNSRLQRDGPACEGVKVTFMSRCVFVPNQTKKTTRQNTLTFRVSPVLASRLVVGLTGVSQVPAMCRADVKQQVFLARVSQRRSEEQGAKKENMAPGGPQEAPRRPQEAPEEAPGRPRRPQEAPGGHRRPPGGPRRPQARTQNFGKNPAPFFLLQFLS